MYLSYLIHQFQPQYLSDFQLLPVVTTCAKCFTVQQLQTEPGGFRWTTLKTASVSSGLWLATLHWTCSCQSGRLSCQEGTERIQLSGESAGVALSKGQLLMLYNISIPYQSWSKHTKLKSDPCMNIQLPCFPIICRKKETSVSQQVNMPLGSV